MMQTYAEESTMNSTQYKKFHESFMENNYGSTALHTFFCIFFTVQCSIYTSLGSWKTVLSQYIHEYVLIVLPMIAAHTILNEHIFLLNFLMFCLLLHDFSCYYQTVDLVGSFRQLNRFETKKIQFISCLRGLTYMITVFSILAVDFQAFPRHLAKTESYGFSFMDTGVGLFVLMSGLVHKNIHGNIITILKSHSKFVCILIFLGIARFVSVKMLDYQEHVSEYGVHWNFFFTLAVCKVISTVLLYFTSHALLFSVATLCLHEFMLYKSLQSWVFSDAPRDDFLTANREGISSSLGYVSLYLFAVYLKNKFTDVYTLRCNLILKLLLSSAFLWMFLFYVNNYRPISRTLANAAYCLYIAAILVTLCIVLYFFEVVFQDKERKLRFVPPLIISAINDNGLLFFLTANLLTGAINMSTRTMLIPNDITFAILNGYMVFNIVVCLLLKKMGIRI